MSSKPKALDNNENREPTHQRKRIKTIPSQPIPVSRKAPKFQSALSPSKLPTEYLEEMGIGMLDSEESSSSLPATFAFPTFSTASADENSNESTLTAADAVKASRSQRLATRSYDSTSTDNSSNMNLGNKTATIGSMQSSISGNNNDGNAVEEIHSEQLKFMDKTQQHRKATGFSATQVSGALYSSPSLSAATRGTRSPLAMVACNSSFSNIKTINQQQLQQQQQQTQQQHTLSSTANASSNTSHPPPHTVMDCEIGMGQNAHLTQIHTQTQQQQSPLQSPVLPSTSAQASLLQYQKYQMLLYTQCLERTQQAAQHLPRFLYRGVHAKDEKDYFGVLSDEIILQVFKWLPKKTLLRCGLVSRRFNRCANDESLWTRLDLGGRTLRTASFDNILTRGVVILRLAQAQLNDSIFSVCFQETHMHWQSKLQYLDLSMATITKPSLKLLLSHCRQLKKLSLEHVPINDDICNEIANNKNLEALNLAMCNGLEAWSVRKMLESLVNLNSLNISWTNLSVDAVTSLVTNVTPNLMRLNVAGCRKTMFDSHLGSLAKRCPQLLELDLSDCTGLTGNAIGIICTFKMLEYLSLSRCYLIPASAYIELSSLSTLTYLDVFGIFSESAMETMEHNFPSLGINKFIHSSVARPTVGTRRTSVWGLRTRDK